MDSLPTELWGRGFILQKKRKSLVGLQIFKYGTGAKVQTFGPCWEASESTELAPATESESGVGLRRTQRGQCRRWGWGLQTDFLCFPKLEITILFAFRRLWGKILKHPVQERASRCVSRLWASSWLFGGDGIGGQRSQTSASIPTEV